MRRLVIIGKYDAEFFGGMERFTNDIFHDLQKIGYHVEVLDVPSKKQLHRDKTTVRLPYNVFGQPLFLPRPVKWARSLKSADVVLLNAPHPLASLYLLPFLPKRKFKLVTVAHAILPKGHIVASMANQFDARLFEASDLVLTTSPQTKSLLLTAHPNINSNISVLPLGMAPKPQSEIQSPGDDFLFIGRMTGYKGVPTLLEAFAANSHRLHLIGDGPFYPRYRQLSRRLGLQDRVKFLGPVSEAAKSKHLQEARALILPSIDQRESFGYAILEAMSHGRAVISTELGTATSWVNQHKKTGLVIAPNSSSQLRDAVQELAQSPETAARFGQNGYHRLRELFHRHRMSSSLFDRIESLFLPTKMNNASTTNSYTVRSDSIR